MLKTKQSNWAGETAPWLRVLAALATDLASLRTHVRAHNCSSASRGSNTLLGLVLGHLKLLDSVPFHTETTIHFHFPLADTLILSNALTSTISKKDIRICLLTRMEDGELVRWPSGWRQLTPSLTTSVWSWHPHGVDREGIATSCLPASTLALWHVSTSPNKQIVFVTFLIYFII